MDYAIATGEHVTSTYGHSSGHAHVLALVVPAGGVACFTSFTNALSTLLAKERVHQAAQRGSLVNAASLADSLPAPPPLQRARSH